MNPLVSIITPSYNSAEFIASTIESIQAQSFTDWELLITDDCSTDNSIEIIKCYETNDSRIKHFVLPVNSGAGVARNYSIERAVGRYIAFCDSDDRWYPTKLEQQLKFMESKQCGLCFGSYDECDEAGNICGFVRARKQLTSSDIKHCNQVGCLTAIYDTNLVGKVFMPTIRKRQDWALWINVINKCDVAYSIQEPLGIYRVRQNSISRDKFDLVKYNAAVYCQVYGYPKWKAILYTILVNIPTIAQKKHWQKKKIR